MTEASARLSAALAGRYRIERELGAGGMATVYLAFDEKHDRKVAIKVLKPELAAVLGAERFVVEIKTTAAMSHPHILPLFDSGTADGFLFYVMPYIEGETIREKLNRETQFGVDEAVRVGREVADALDYAHRHGIIHRDIKPENILLHDGRAMVMDFGIALAVSAAAGGRMTETGLSLGTPHYMSPEQATAEKEITPRSDVYSLASVLYEMLAGEPPHTGGTAQAVIMKIITEQAQPVRQLRKNVPPNVEAALAQALEKLPADRFQSAKEFGDALRSEHFTHASHAGPGGVAGGAALSRRTTLVAAAVTIAAVAFGVWGWMRPRAAAAPVVPLTLELPNARPDIGRFAVSRDGSRFAFGNDEGIIVRDSGKREYRLLPGTANGESPSFSPDGQWLVYQAQGHLRKIALAGGASVSVVANDSVRGGRIVWGVDGTIVFERASRLYAVSPSGALRELAKADRAEAPRMMPDGSGVFYVDTRTGAKLMFYDLAADTTYALIEDSGEGMYLPSGHLLYAAQGGGLFAVAYDAKRHRVTGTPMPVASDILPTGNVSPFDVTGNGTLVYRAGLEPEMRVAVREPSGKADTLPMPPRVIGYVRASPDGRTLAVTVGSARGTNRYTAFFDLALGSLTRFTQEGGGHAPVWSPDGQRMAFTADILGGDGEDVFVQPIDRSSPAVRLFKMPNDQHSVAWPSDTVLVFANASAPGLLGAQGRAGGGLPSAVYTVNPAKPGSAPKPYLVAEWGQTDANISPDGKWAAFTSLETGAPEILVRPFPVADAGGVVKVSNGGGQRARWSGDGRAIYYQALDSRTIKMVRVTTGATVTVGATDVVATVQGLGNAWDVDRKSGRIYYAQAVGGEQAHIVVIQNWYADFLRHLEAKR